MVPQCYGSLSHQNYLAFFSGSTRPLQGTGRYKVQGTGGYKAPAAYCNHCVVSLENTIAAAPHGTPLFPWQLSPPAPSPQLASKPPHNRQASFANTRLQGSYDAHGHTDHHGGTVNTPNNNERTPEHLGKFIIMSHYYT